MQRYQGIEGQRDIWPGHAASSFHGRKVVQLRAEREPRAPRKTRRAHKQSHVASGRGGRGRAKSRRLFRQQRDGAAARDKYCAPATAQHSGSRDATRDPPQRLSPCECQDPPHPPRTPSPPHQFPRLLPRSPPAFFSIFPARRIPWASQAGSCQSVPSVGRVRARYHAVPWAGLAVPGPELGEDGGRLEALLG